MRFSIYLKSQKRPFDFECKSDEFEKLKHLLQTRDIIEFGPLIFSRDNLAYVIRED